MTIKHSVIAVSSLDPPFCPKASAISLLPLKSTLLKVSIIFSVFTSSCTIFSWNPPTKTLFPSLQTNNDSCPHNPRPPCYQIHWEVLRLYLTQSPQHCVPGYSLLQDAPSLVDCRGTILTGSSLVWLASPQMFLLISPTSNFGIP